ncbi:MAG: TIGR02147 family protein [Bdellovibrio sp.]
METIRSVYEFNSYKKIMSLFLTGEGKRGQLSRASELLKCQPSFLSRAMSTEIHITPDQAFMLTQFWQLDDSESEYFQCLVEFERASEPKFKEHIQKKIIELKKAHESLQNRTKKSDFNLNEQQAIYFSSWVWSAIHFLVSIPEFQNVHQISSRLGLNESTTKYYLDQLSHFGLIKKNGKKWEYSTGQFHLPKSSPFVSLHHQNWRSRAVIDSQNPLADGLHYTSVLTLSKEDFQRLKELLLKFVSESEAIARPSDPQEIATLAFDLFKI